MAGIPPKEWFDITVSVSQLFEKAGKAGVKYETAYQSAMEKGETWKAFEAIDKAAFMAVLQNQLLPMTGQADDAEWYEQKLHRIESEYSDISKALGFGQEV
jgi:archaellum component FlaC